MKADTKLRTPNYYIAAVGAYTGSKLSQAEELEVGS